NSDDKTAKAEEGRKKRTAFARQYLEKLINIQVPVPALNNELSADLFTAEFQSADAPLQNGWLRNLTAARLRQVLAVALLASVLGTIFWFGMRAHFSFQTLADNKNKPSSTGTTSPSAPTPPGAPQVPSAPPKEKEKSSEAVLTPGQPEGRS